MKKILPLLLFFVFATLAAEKSEHVFYKKMPKAYRYRVYLADKKNNSYSLKKPEVFLSEKSLARRKRLGIKLDKHDLPVSSSYLQELQAKGLRIHCVSKWNNTVVVEMSDTLQVEALKHLSFVTGIRKVWESKDSVFCHQGFSRSSIIENKRDTLENYYGKGYKQISQLAADDLHKAGYCGQGMTIAVIDGGFFNVDSIAAFRHTKILGTRNFVNPDKSVYEELQPHGTMVLGCIAPNGPYSHVGTAPEASFYLLQSEDTSSEQPIEEDNWCAAVEYADSLGVDIVTSSLGYTTFDKGYDSHKYFEADGKTAVNSRVASLAASRGILLLNSAGNEGDGTWKKIGFPADAPNILTVGAVDYEGVNTIFSSLGNTADGRIKPEVMAVGAGTWVVNAQGNLEQSHGTSFSCPVLCGAVACLWQAFPEKTPLEIISAVVRSANNYEHPDNVYGYGIPNMWKAYNLLKKQ